MDSRSTFLHQLTCVITDGVTRKGKRTHCWTCAVFGVGGIPRQIPGSITPRPDRKRVFGQANSPTPCRQEKPLGSIKLSVPQTDTGRRGENPKADESSLVKELGNLAP